MKARSFVQSECLISGKNIYRVANNSNYKHMHDALRFMCLYFWTIFHCITAFLFLFFIVVSFDHFNSFEKASNSRLCSLWRENHIPCIIFHSRFSQRVDIFAKLSVLVVCTSQALYESY